MTHLDRIAMRMGEIPPHVLVGFSGGCDSTALVLLLEKKQVQLTCVHVHHGMRGEEADADEENTTLVLSDEQMAKMALTEEFILTISENGFGKRTSSYEYRLTHRGGNGFTNIKLGGKNTAVAGSFPVTDDQDIMMVTNGGKIIRTPASDVRIAGRSTAGVTLFRTAEGEKVVSAIAIEKADEENETETVTEAEVTE